MTPSPNQERLSKQALKLGLRLKVVTDRHGEPVIWQLLREEDGTPQYQTTDKVSLETYLMDT